MAALTDDKRDLIGRILDRRMTDADRGYVYHAMKKRKPDSKAYLRFPRFKPNHVHNYDLLFLPREDDYKYVFVAIDLGSRMVGLEPIKNKKAQTTRDALERILKRTKMKLPDRVLVDAGTEFAGEFAKDLQSKGVIVKRIIPDRHQNNLIVESLNRKIGKIVFHLQYLEEEQSGWKEHNTQFRAAIAEIERKMNETAKAKLQAIKDRLKDYKPTYPLIPATMPKSAAPKNRREIARLKAAAVKPIDKKILPIGTEVYKYLEAPRDPISNTTRVVRDSGRKLAGRFRETDLRIEKKPRKITNWYILPDQRTIAYNLSGFTDRDIFTRNDFRII